MFNYPKLEKIQRNIQDSEEIHEIQEIQSEKNKRSRDKYEQTSIISIESSHIFEKDEFSLESHSLKKFKLNLEPK